jgi:hypothetical protein
MKDITKKNGRVTQNKMKKFTTLSGAINYLFSIGQNPTHQDIQSIGIEIELRGEIYL